MNFNNKVIEVLDLEHGKKVKNFFESIGVNTYNFRFDVTKAGGLSPIYYGIVNGVFSNYNIREVLEAGAEIINLNNMNQLTIEIPEGHEIDLINSDLSKGLVKFQPIKKSYQLSGRT